MRTLSVAVSAAALALAAALTGIAVMRYRTHGRS
jgi:hypothetical protein